MSLNCNYLQLDMLQLSEVTVGRSYSCLWLQLAKVTVVCGYIWQKLQLTFYTCLLTLFSTITDFIVIAQCDAHPTPKKLKTIDAKPP